MLKRSVSCTSCTTRRIGSSSATHHQAATGTLSPATKSTAVPPQVNLKALGDTAVGNTNKTQAQVLGNPPNMCRIKLPPSIPLYVKRNHLVSMFNAQDPSHVSMQNEWVHPWKNLFISQTSLPIYHKIMSNSSTASPVDLLVSSNNNNCLAALDLNGLNDWFVFGSFGQNIVAFENNSSLAVSPRVSYFSKGANSEASHTGLFKKYIHINGRGVCVVQSRSGSSIYSIQLKDAKDEILVRLDNLLGCSAANYKELMENITPYHFNATTTTANPPRNNNNQESKKSKWSFLNVFKKSRKNTPKKEVIVSTHNTQSHEKIEDFSLKEFVRMSKSIVTTTTKYIKYVYYQFINGNLSLSGLSGMNLKNVFATNYATIKGPRSILIQSNSINAELLNKIMSPKSNTSMESFVSPASLNKASSQSTAASEQIQLANKDKTYLNYAYVDIKNKKVFFQSTQNFNETIKEMSQRKN